MNIIFLLNKLTKRGLGSNYWVLNNKKSRLITTTFKDENITFQLVPAGLHRRNAVELLIHTFRTQFVTRLLFVDPCFPLYIWNTMIAHCDTTLNMLLASKI